MWFIQYSKHKAASFSEMLLHIYQSIWSYTTKDKYSKSRRFILPKETLTARRIKNLITYELHVQQPFFKRHASDGKKRTILVIWGGGSLAY
jgi:hypothetical protein